MIHSCVSDLIGAIPVPENHDIEETKMEIAKLYSEFENGNENDQFFEEEENPLEPEEYQLIITHDDTRIITNVDYEEEELEYHDNYEEDYAE